MTNYVDKKFEGKYNFMVETDLNFSKFVKQNPEMANINFESPEGKIFKQSACIAYRHALHAKIHEIKKYS